ncbi:MAG: flotillin-like protein FloA [Clostridia bacterium]
MISSLVIGGGTIALIVVGGLLVLSVILMLILVPVGTWFVALISGAYVSMSRLIGMKLRRVKVPFVVKYYIMAKKAGINVDVTALETHWMADGDIKKVVEALISAKNANIALAVEKAMAIDLAGRDVDLAVKQTVKPQVVATDWISAVAKDEIEIKVIIKITVRVNLNRLVGGAGQETIIARVGEGVVTIVGSMETYTDVLENPDYISKTILSKKLDTDTAYEILSIDLDAIEVGKNIGAKLRSDEADSKKNIAQAVAEERRAMAVANEQEMRAKTQEARATVLIAESEVPKAIAEAIKSGKLGVMDYYRMQNLLADTEMRNAIAGDDSMNKKQKENKE